MLIQAIVASLSTLALAGPLSPPQGPPRCAVIVRATNSDAKTTEFTCRCRLNTPVEVNYHRNAGIRRAFIPTKLYVQPAANS